MQYYFKSKEDVILEFQSGTAGLTEQEAGKRLGENGKNKLAEGKKISLLERFIKQLIDPMILILIAAAAISGVTAAYAKESFADVFIILFVVIINAVLGVYQENKAEKAIEALNEMAAATSKVIRDGQQHTIRSEDIVIGDVIVLEAGDAVPADARIIECASMKIEEAALTGESVPVTKKVEILATENGGDVPLGDRKNMVYMGSVVVYGRGKAVVTATGMNTEMGKIADAIAQAQDNATPLQIKLAGLSKILSFLVIGICAFIFAFRVIKVGDFSAEVMLDTFMVAVSLAVAAIPEGLAAVVTIVLSIGVTNMSKRNAVIRKLTAVETLGCAQVICSDKTGTLTQNKMTVVDFYSEEETLLATAMALCNDADVDDTGNTIGEPTESALVNYATKLSLFKSELKQKYPRIGEAPFDSMRKMMSTHHEYDGKVIQFTKGAPDEVLKVCTRYVKNGEVVELTEEIRRTILEENKRMAGKALRVLMAAYKEYNTMPVFQETKEIESDLIFIGLTGMIDPIRPEVLPAIKECKAAGIRPIMITGDHKDTAVAIATELGILESPAGAITGAMLNDISEEEFQKTIEKYSVYARVQPEHKVRIVNAWKADGMITAMTGDGVNDAPSIKSADIGIGMGITGTDVTKNVADMVLADDNFATIVTAVKEGRKIYDNIKKSIQFLLASNLSEVLAIFFATVLGFTILHPVHILWINLITDTFPALALGMEKGEEDLMRRKPRPAKEGIFSGGVGFDIAYQGLLIALVTLSAYFVGHRIESGVWEIANSPDGITMAFLTMSLAEIFQSINMRSQRGSIFKMKNINPYLFGAMVISLVLTTAVIYLPGVSAMFRFERINALEYVIAVGLAVTVIPVVEVVKVMERGMIRNK